MKKHLQITILITIFSVISFQSKAQENAMQVIAQDKDFQFAVEGSGSYRLIMKDVKMDSVILEIAEMDCRPVKFYEHQARYFFLCRDHNKKSTVWEIEIELGRIMLLDLTSEDLKTFRNLTE